MIRVTQLTVTPKDDDPIFTEGGFTVTMEDEAAGEFVIVSANCEGTPIRIDPAEWPELRTAIDRMVSYCRDNP